MRPKVMAARNAALESQISIQQYIKQQFWPVLAKAGCRHAGCSSSAVGDEKL
jgi:hypothetical protein